MTYRLVQDWQQDRFVAAVNKALADGWQLVGGVAITDTGVNRWWAQAMVKS